MYGISPTTVGRSRGTAKVTRFLQTESGRVRGVVLELERGPAELAAPTTGKEPLPGAFGWPEDDDESSRVGALEPVTRPAT